MPMYPKRPDKAAANDEYSPVVQESTHDVLSRKGYSEEDITKIEEIYNNAKEDSSTLKHEDWKPLDKDGLMAAGMSEESAAQMVRDHELNKAAHDLILRDNTQARNVDMYNTYDENQATLIDNQRNYEAEQARQAYEAEKQKEKLAKDAGGVFATEEQKQAAAEAGVEPKDSLPKKILKDMGAKGQRKQDEWNAELAAEEQQRQESAAYHRRLDAAMSHAADAEAAQKASKKLYDDTAKRLKDEAEQKTTETREAIAADGKAYYKEQMQGAGFFEAVGESAKFMYDNSLLTKWGTALGEGAADVILPMKEAYNEGAQSVRRDRDGSELQDTVDSITSNSASVGNTGYSVDDD